MPGVLPLVPAPFVTSWIQGVISSRCPETANSGLPLGVVPSAADVHDTRLFPHLLRLALAVCAAIGRLYADAAYDSADNRGLCAREGIQPFIREVGQPHGSGLGTVRCIVEHNCAWLLANKRLDRRHDRRGRMI